MLECDARRVSVVAGRPARRRARWGLPVSLVIAVCLVAAACGGSDNRIAVSGYVRVNSMDLLLLRGPETGFPCDSADFSFADIENGAPLVVTDGKGKRLGATKLGEGSTYVNFTGERTGGCEWPFKVTLASAQVYRFAAAGQPPVVLSAADVKANPKQLELRFGTGT